MAVLLVELGYFGASCESIWFVLALALVDLSMVLIGFHLVWVILVLSWLVMLSFWLLSACFWLVWGRIECCNLGVQNASLVASKPLLSQFEAVYRTCVKLSLQLKTDWISPASSRTHSTHTHTHTPVSPNTPVAGLKQRGLHSGPPHCNALCPKADRSESNTVPKQLPE